MINLAHLRYEKGLSILELLGESQLGGVLVLLLLARGGHPAVGGRDSEISDDCGTDILSPDLESLLGVSQENIYTVHDCMCNSCSARMPNLGDRPPAGQLVVGHGYLGQSKLVHLDTVLVGGDRGGPGLPGREN